MESNSFSEITVAKVSEKELEEIKHLENKLNNKFIVIALEK